jgi:hypothetical protein
MATAFEELRKRGLTVPVYDEHGQRMECEHGTHYTLSPAGLDEAARQSPHISVTPEDYAQAQKMLDRALRFDRETRARFGVN